MNPRPHPLDDGPVTDQLDAIAENPQAAIDSGMFEIRTKDRANRAVWRLGRELEDLAEDETLYASEIQRLDEWIRRRRKRVENIRWFVEGLCAAYHATVLATDQRRKTIKLPAGELEAHKQPDSLVVDDPVLAVAWAEANGHEDLVRRTDPEIRKPETKALIKATSQAIPGVTIVAGEVRFSVTPYHG